ncbi:MAG: translation initiation factor IF-2, partial [Deinococcus sp.]|nr:translation initiation factor IF-2 [Deinococcus sp.]
MEKVRIYDLAKELGVTTKEMLAVLDSMGVVYKSHSSTLDADTAATVKELFKSQTAPAPPKPAARAEPAAPQAKPQPAPCPPPAPPPEAAQPAPAPAPRPAPKPKTGSPRAPVVTVMGHVDHGKTTLLDYIRKANVAAGEAGGITQHIGAYRAETSKGPIVFIDTPGHEAFTSLRARGAQLTDIVVLVVAGDDGVMPQTREAIAHARAANVPIIVVLNKMDLPGVERNKDRVLNALMEEQLVPEEYGGDTPVVPISARTGKGVDHLLEMIALVAELAELRAEAKGPAQGRVVEVLPDKQKGVLTTILVQEGQLNRADTLVAGTEYCRVRAMFNDRGEQIQSAGPSTPVQVLGFSGLPTPGDLVKAVENERAARELVTQRQHALQASLQPEPDRRQLALEQLLSKSDKKLVNLILKADTPGSLEALKNLAARAGTEDVTVTTLVASAGAITEGDVLLASANKEHPATILSFNVRPSGLAQKSAERYGVNIISKQIIYELVDEMTRLVRGQVEPVITEVVLGRAEVRETFKVPKVGTIAGSYVQDGKIVRNALARLIRSYPVIYDSRAV